MEQCILTFPVNSVINSKFSINVANAYAVKRASAFFVDIYYNTVGETTGKVQVITLNFNSSVVGVDIEEIIYNAILEAQQAPRSIVEPKVPNADNGKLFAVLPIRYAEKDPI